MLRLLLALLLVPSGSQASDLRQSMVGQWTGSGSVQIRPTSKAKTTKCSARFGQSEGLWLNGALTCRKGRHNEEIFLQFLHPGEDGEMHVHLLDDDGDQLVSLIGRMSGNLITLLHPEVLEFSGTQYRPVLSFQMSDNKTLTLAQHGVPLAQENGRYVMSNLVFRKKK